MNVSFVAPQPNIVWAIVPDRRWKVLLEYFNEEVEWDHCGHCDNCITPPEKVLSARPTHSNEMSAKATSIRRGQASDIEKSGSEPRFAVGAEIEVPKIGKGKIASSSYDMVTIIFPDGQKRTFLKSYVKPIGKAPKIR